MCCCMLSLSRINGRNAHAFRANAKYLGEPSEPSEPSGVELDEVIGIDWL